MLCPRCRQADVRRLADVGQERPDGVVLRCPYCGAQAAGADRAVAQRRLPRRGSFRLAPRCSGCGRDAFVRRREEVICIHCGEAPEPHARFRRKPLERPATIATCPACGEPKYRRWERTSVCLGCGHRGPGRKRT